MGMMKNKHIDYLNQKDFAAEVQKDLADQSKFFAERQEGTVFKVDKIAKSVAEENDMDEYRMRQYERDQEDLFDSMDYNWSGNR